MDPRTIPANMLDCQVARFICPTLKLSRDGQRMKCGVRWEDAGANNDGPGRRWLGRLDGLSLHVMLNST
jgi:hypothetical protein